MSYDELKEKGNECIRQKSYKDAALYYTSALSKDPCSHTVFSNRSLAYSKLKQFENALQDANKCIELAPNFARGYLRKSVALAGLGENSKALAAAEQGYKLRGSDTICQSCVGQWLEANDSLLKEKVDRCLQEIDLPRDAIPRGCRILSDDYLTIFLNVFLCRLQFTTTGVEVGFIASCIHNLFEELDRILQLFGHVPASIHSMEWLVAFALASKVDPSTSRVPQEVAASFVGKSTDFSTWLDTEIDHALYPILSPIISLVMIAINARCISLNVLNSDQSVTQTTCRACLSFFEKPILSGSDYLLQHIAVYKELLEAFGTSNYVFTRQDIKFGQDCITKLESLLKRCPSDEVSKDVSDKAAVSISLAQIRLQESPKFDPVEHAPKSGKAVSRIGAVDRDHLKEYAGKKLEALKNDLNSVMMEFSHEDVQDLLSCIGKTRVCVCVYVCVCVGVYNVHICMLCGE